MTAIGLACIALLSAGIAFMIYTISSAHGHGMAAPDRLAILLLALVALASGAGALWRVRRRRS